MSDPKILSWENKPERKAWSTQLLSSISTAMPSLGQARAEIFLPGYDGLSPDLQIKFWAELLIAMSWFESKWKPSEIYHEPPPLGVDSVGLLQLSYEDEKPYGLEKLSREKKSLEDPLVNLRCGVAILAKLTSHDKVVESSAGKKYGGASRYWSVIRQGEKHHLEEIRARVKDAVWL